MRIKNQITAFGKSYKVVPVICALLIGGLMAHLIGATQAAPNNSIYLSPASGSYQIGDTVTLSVRENSGATNVNAVEADLSYTAAQLQYLSTDFTGTSFELAATSSGGSGSVTIARATSNNTLAGDHLIAAVSFKVLASGSSAISFKSSSALAGTSDSKSTNATTQGATLTLTTPPVTPPPTPTPTPPPAGGGSTQTPAPAPTAAPSGSKPAASSKSVAVTPSGSSTPVALSDNANAQVSAAATIQPTQSAGDPITKAEYFLNGKLVATATQPPYSYKLDTPNLRNGKYTLQVKTFYTSGKIALTAHHIDVKNPLSLKQLLLEAKHYAWAFILPVLIIAAFVYVRFLRGKTGSWPRFGSDGGSDTPPADPDKHIQAFMSGQAQVIAPGSEPATIPSSTMPTIKINNTQLGKAKNPQPGSVVEPNETKT
jgi:hypothetical protein